MQGSRYSRYKKDPLEKPEIEIPQHRKVIFQRARNPTSKKTSFSQITFRPRGYFEEDKKCVQIFISTEWLHQKAEEEKNGPDRVPFGADD